MVFGPSSIEGLVIIIFITEGTSLSVKIKILIEKNVPRKHFYSLIVIQFLWNIYHKIELY